MNANETVSTLLGRDTFVSDGSMGEYFLNRMVLITGAGGSIGSGLCQALSMLPCRIVAYDRSENNLTKLLAESRNDGWEAAIIPFLGDVTQISLLNHAFSSHHPYIVIHAAAYKHLPLLEAFPLQAVENNVMGTVNVLNAARYHNVHKFVLVSTDKSCNPTSIMGATKRLAEMVTLNPSPEPLKTTVVRLGNVLGSSGSVLPLFESQIAAGGPITVTHPDATRFFMSIPEAANLILTAAAMGTGQETFVLDMGQPVNIAAMAKRLAVIRGRGDIEIHFTGMRPGEKLTEQLYTGDTTTTTHPRIWRIKNEAEYKRLITGIKFMSRHLDNCDKTAVWHWLHKLVPEYHETDMVPNV